MFRVLTWNEFLGRTGMTAAEFGIYLDMDEEELAAGLPSSARHLHDGETLFVGVDHTGPCDEAGFPLELWGAHGQVGNGELAALSRRNGLHSFEQLDLAPASDDGLAKRPPRLLMVDGAREAAQDDFKASFAALREARARVRGWEVVGAIANFNASTFVAAIEGGVDAVVFVTHGVRPNAVSPSLWFGGDDRTSVPWAVVDEALRRNPRPLRFACVVACELYPLVVATLRSLAAARRLHAHFGGVVLRGSPDMTGGLVFVAALLDTLVLLGEHGVVHKGEDHELAAAAPLAFAVQEARRRVWDELARDPARSRETVRLETTRARLVHARPGVRPFPVGRELERERYLASLEAGLFGVVRHA